MYMDVTRQSRKDGQSSGEQKIQTQVFGYRIYFEMDCQSGNEGEGPLI